MPASFPSPNPPSRESRVKGPETAKRMNVNRTKKFAVFDAPGGKLPLPACLTSSSPALFFPAPPLLLRFPRFLFASIVALT